MVEPETIINYLNNFFITQAQFLNKRVLITAGPTYEYIDPVRFIGNFSSGKMGYEIANEFLNRGADVILVSGPTKEELSHPNLKLIRITTADEMLENVQLHWSNCNIGVFSAAVADYRPDVVANTKIKKKEDNLIINLVKNPDILSWAGKNKTSDQFLVGFALETNDAIEYGRNKLNNKNLNAIVINSLSDKGAGFGGDTNKISILSSDNELQDFELKTKSEVAFDIVNFIKDKH